MLQRHDRHNVSRENLHAMRLSTSIKTDLHERIVLVEIRLVQDVGFEVVVDQRLPSRRQAEDIEAIDTGEMLHLALGHCGRRAAILLFELIGSEVALSSLISSWVFNAMEKSVSLTLVSIPISQPAMLTPASQTALAWTARVDTKRERRAMVDQEQREVLRRG